MQTAADEMPGRAWEGQEAEPLLFSAAGIRFLIGSDSRTFRDLFRRVFPVTEFPGEAEATVTCEMTVSPPSEAEGQWQLCVQGKAFTTRRTPLSLIHDLEGLFRSEICARGKGLMVFHSGAVADKAGAILLAGPSGTGKSTLVARCVQQGFGYLSEELGILNPLTGMVSAYPKYFTLSRTSARLLFGASDLKALEQQLPAIASDGILDVSPDLIRPGTACARAPLRAVVFPKHASCNACVRLTRAEALRKLTEHLLPGPPRAAGELEALMDHFQNLNGIALSFSDLDFALACLAEL